MKKIYLAIMFALVSTMGAWAQTNYISEIKISVGSKDKAQKKLTDDGYTIVKDLNSGNNKDLNEGGGGEYVYLGYKTTTNPAQAITNILIVQTIYYSFDTRHPWYKTTPYHAGASGADYYRCDSYGDELHDCDLNRGRDNSADITLYYTKYRNNLDGGTPLTEIKVADHTNATDYQYTRLHRDGSTNEDFYGNTNEGGDSDDPPHYIVFKTHTHNFSATFNWSADGQKCSVQAQCECGLKSSGNATITSMVKIPATYRVDGITTYTAEITLSGKVFTDTKDVQIVLTFEEVKTAVKGMIDEMVAAETRANMSSLGSDYKAQVDAAATREDVWTIIDAFPAALDAAAALALTQAKEDATAAIQAVLQGETNAVIIQVGNTAITDISNASSVADVNTYKEETLAEIQRLRELFQAKEEAIAAIYALVGGTTDDLAIEVANKYIASIEAATKIENVASLRSEAESLITTLLADPIAFAFTFSGANMPTETQHKLEGLKMTYSEDGDQMTFTVNGTTVTYPLSQVGELSLFRGTPAVELTTHENPADPGFYYTTFYSGLEAYAIPEDVKAFTAELTFAGDALIVTQITNGVLPQDEGVLLESTSADAITLETTNPATGTKDNGNVFRGSDVYINRPTGTTYVISAVDNVMAFYQYTGDVIPANKAYMNLSEGQSAPRRIVWSTEHTGVATGMENAAATDQAEKFLHNGTLYIRKGEHVYNVQGVIVK